MSRLYIQHNKCKPTDGVTVTPLPASLQHKNNCGHIWPRSFFLKLH